MRLSLALSLFVTTAAALFAQVGPVPGDGRRPVEKTGIALVKPQKWSAPNQAQVVRFTAYTNRGGYFVLRLANGQERQVWVAQLVGDAPILRPEPPAELVEPDQREELAAQILKIRNLGQSVPSARDELAEFLQPLEDMLAKFDSGQVLVDGRWEDASTHRRTRFDLLEAQLRSALAMEKSIVKFNIAENASYREIQGLASKSPELLPKLKALQADHDRLVSLERQAEFVSQLSNPNLTESTIRQILTRLRVFPDPGPETQKILDQARTADLIAKETAAVKIALENFFAKEINATAVPALPSDLGVRIATLEAEAEKFRASSPPRALRVPEDSIRSATLIREKMPHLAGFLSTHQYPQAIELIDNLETASASIGTSTRGFFIDLKTKTESSSQSTNEPTAPAPSPAPESPQPATP